MFCLLLAFCVENKANTRKRVTTNTALRSSACRQTVGRVRIHCVTVTLPDRFLKEFDPSATNCFGDHRGGEDDCQTPNSNIYDDVGKLPALL